VIALVIAPLSYEPTFSGRKKMKIKIALAQVSASDSREENIRNALVLMEQAKKEGASLICFPEMAFDPFFPLVRADKRYFALAEPIPGPMVERFQEKAKELELVTVINMYERAAPGEYYDCSPVINVDGSLMGISRMMHIAELPNYNEKFYYWEGNTGFPVFDTGVAKVGIAICYDRHFPEQMRALTLNGAEIILVPTATSTLALKHIWEMEMQAAAVANQVFVAVVNRVGIEGPVMFFGRSFVTNPTGEVVARAEDGKEELLVTELDLDLIEQARQVLPFLRDRRPEAYKTMSVVRSKAI
jgi:N-carbamoylputrescine amidase